MEILKEKRSSLKTYSRSNRLAGPHFRTILLKSSFFSAFSSLLPSLSPSKKIPSFAKPRSPAGRVLQKMTFAGLLGLTLSRSQGEAKASEFSEEVNEALEELREVRALFFFGGGEVGSVWSLEVFGAVWVGWLIGFLFFLFFLVEVASAHSSQAIPTIHQD